MSLAGISYRGKTGIVFLDNGRGKGGRQRVGRGLTAQRYIDDVLRPVAVPYVRRHRDIMLQHDDARPHVAYQTTQFLRQANVRMLDNWPALSSDLNPMEHCWDFLKQRIRKMQLDTADQLREWRCLPMVYVRRLIRSMRDRCNAVVAANGGTHTVLVQVGANEIKLNFIVCYASSA